MDQQREEVIREGRLIEEMCASDGWKLLVSSLKIWNGRLVGMLVSGVYDEGYTYDMARAEILALQRLITTPKKFLQAKQLAAELDTPFNSEEALD